MKNKTNLFGFVGKSEENKDKCIRIWKGLDTYYTFGTEYWKKWCLVNNQNQNFILNEVMYVEEFLKGTFTSLSNWERKSFAQKIKQICSIITGCSEETIDSCKNDKVPDWMTLYSLPGQGVSTQPFVICGNESFRHQRTYEELQEYISNDLLKNHIHPHVHIGMLFNDYKQKRVLNEFSGWEKDYPMWLISDVNFKHEADAIKDRGGKIIKVSDPSDEPTNINFDYIIDNTDDIEILIQKVKEIMINDHIILL